MTFRLFAPLERIDPQATPWLYRGVVYQHVQRYEFARPLVKGKKVLDIACGVGYGSRILSETAEHVTGMDISSDSIACALRQNQSPRTAFQEADGARLPLPDQSMDAVVSFETIEHLTQDQVGPFLNEIYRVLKPNGLLLMSTPDREVFSLGDTSANPFHLWEFSRAEFIARVSRTFQIEAEYGQCFAPSLALKLFKGLARLPGAKFTHRLWRLPWSLLPSLSAISEFPAHAGRPLYTLLKATKRS